jgi:hypothetical protein
MQEYLAGSNPLVPESSLNPVLSLTVAIDGSTIQFVAVAGKAYTLWYCNDLSAGAWTQLATIASPAQTGTVSVKDPAMGVKTRFYRLSTP